MMDQAGAERAIAALNGMVLRGRKITVKVAEENRQQKPAAFKTNRFSGTSDRTGDSMVSERKGKRPRKLVSDTFSAEKIINFVQLGL